jgi:hypothetical protein
VAKYEMKNPGDDGTQAEGIRRKDEGQVPQAKPEQQPWIHIHLYEAREACAQMSTPRFQVSLINNAEWQTIARNIETEGRNWSGGKVGSGVLNRGHSDGSPNMPLAADPDDRQGYFATQNRDTQAPGEGWEQKRTHILSNGQILWDFVGNCSEWLTDTVSSLGLDVAKITDEGDLTTLPAEYRLILGGVGNFGRDTNTGVFWAFEGSAILRGGYWSWPEDAGLYYADLGYGPGFAEDNKSFRCVARAR